MVDILPGTQHLISDVHHRGSSPVGAAADSVVLLGTLTEVPEGDLPVVAGEAS
jgi:hypothetical protein